LGAGIPLYREWGSAAWGPYLAGAVASGLVAAGARRLGSRRWPIRVLLALAVFAGAGLGPMVWEAVERSETFAGYHAQSEVIIIEEAATALLDGRDPYAVSYAEGPLAARPPGVQEHFPYQPAMIAFGLPRALDGRSWLADARIWLSVITMAAIGLGLIVLGKGFARPLRIFQVLLVLPTGAALLSGGAHVLPVLGLMFLALALADRGRPLWAGSAVGIASALMPFALPLVPFLAAASDRPAWRRVILGRAMPLVAVVPFLLWGPAAYLEDTVSYPFGLAAEATTAQATSPGSLVARVVPKWLLAVGVLLLLAGWTAFRLRAGPPLTAAGAAREAAVVLAAAVLLSPTARLAYAVFPIGLAVCAWALVPRPQDVPRATDKTRPMP